MGLAYLAAVLLTAALVPPTEHCSAVLAEGEAVEYVLVIDSNLQTRTSGQPKPQEMVATTEIAYRVDRQGDESKLAIRAVNAKISADGKLLLDRQMNRQGVSFQQLDQPVSNMTYAQAPEALRAMLDEFDEPIARITMDERGAETGREVLQKPGSSLVVNGMIENARFFHAPFDSAKDRWQAPAKLSIGNGLFARGVLTYSKGMPDADGRVPVQVEGELRGDGKFGQNELKNCVYKVDGTQVYDPASRDWQSGKLHIDVSFELLAGGESVSASKGTMLITLQRR